MEYQTGKLRMSLIDYLLNEKGKEINGNINQTLYYSVHNEVPRLHNYLLIFVQGVPTHSLSCLYRNLVFYIASKPLHIYFLLSK